MTAVAVAAFVVAVFAVLISFASYRLARRADSRAEKAELRGERKEHREVIEARERRQGRPVFSPQGGSGGPTAPEIQHSYMLTNGGHSTITHLRLWIEDASGRIVSTEAGGHMALTPGGPPSAVGVQVRQPLPESELTLMVEWTDAESTHRESTGIHPPLHH